MSRQILREQDFLDGNLNNIKNFLYKGFGPPSSLTSNDSLGALYVDNNNGDIWVATLTNTSSTYGWKPYSAVIQDNVKLSQEVQEGDVVALCGFGTWSQAANLNVTTNNAGYLGNFSSALKYTGANPSNVYASTTEVFNGQSWSIGPNATETTTSIGASGSFNSGLLAGGLQQVPGFIALIKTFHFNGSAFSAGGNLSISRYFMGQCGTQLASSVVGGFDSTFTAVTSCQYYNGTSWFSFANVSRTRPVGAAGSQNAIIAMMGLTSSNTFCELFNGSSWSAGASVANLTALTSTNYANGVVGTQNSALAMGLGSATSFSAMFNGSSWILDNNGFTFSTSAKGAGNTQKSIWGNFTLKTYAHTQDVYRRLNASNAFNASSIGMAYKVPVFSYSLTASVISGQLPGFVPSNTFFGLSTWNSGGMSNNSATYSEYPQALTNTLSIASPVSVTGGLATVAFGSGNAISGMYLQRTGDLGAEQYPIVSAIGGSLLVRCPGATLPVGTYTYAFSGRFTEFDGGYTRNANGQVSLSLTTNYSVTFLERWIGGKGGIVKLVQSQSGPKPNHVDGTYAIASTSITSGVMVITYNTSNTNVVSESTPFYGKIELLKNIDYSTVGLDNSTILLGYNRKMQPIVLQDEVSAGFR